MGKLVRDDNLAIGKGRFAVLAGVRVFREVRFGDFADAAYGNVVEMDVDGEPVIVSADSWSLRQWRVSASRGSGCQVPGGKVCNLVAWQRWMRVDTNVSSRVSFLWSGVVLHEVLDGLSVVDDRTGHVLCEVVAAQPSPGHRKVPWFVVRFSLEGIALSWLEVMA